MVRPWLIEQRFNGDISMKFDVNAFLTESRSGFDYQAFGTNRKRDLLDRPSAHRIRLALERLRQRHLLRQGVYFRLRAFLPVLVLALVWLGVETHGHRLPFHTLMNSTVTLRHLLLAMGTVTLWNICLLMGIRTTRSARQDVVAEIRLLTNTAVACGLILFLGNAMRMTWHRGAFLGISLTLALLCGSYLLLLGAFCASADLLHDPSRARKALIIGSGKRASSLRSMVRSSHTRMEIIGCIDETYIGTNPEEDNYLGGFDSLAELLKAQPVELVLIGLPVKSMYEQIQSVIEVCESIGVESHYMADIFATKRATQQSSPSASRFSVLGDSPNNFRQGVKRGLDLLITVPLFLVLLPLLLLVAVAIRFSTPGPVFFIQRRYGRHRKQFPMFKFRTMVVDAEERQHALESLNEAQGPVFKLKADPRVTKLGAFLRRTSLDELPQLINVLRGEMSLVGPRPLPLRDVTRFDEPWLLRRFSAKPGLTCLWQVRGRSNTMFDEWMKLDLEYIDNWSLSLDMMILLQTVPAVLRGSGAM
jgi:exopolysaccharide biosynthesis polyprenyl glycosylphosphotransferase